MLAASAASARPSVSTSAMSRTQPAPPEATTGTDSIVLDKAEVPAENTGDMNAETETVSDALNVYLHASQEGYTLTKASGFAVGDNAYTVEQAVQRLLPLLKGGAPHAE